MQPTEPLIGTCGVCGAPCDPQLFPVLNGKPLQPNKVNKCKTCHKNVCAKCFSNSREICVFCASGKNSWCKTPKMPGL